MTFNPIPRPWRAAVFLPGHQESGAKVLVCRISCASEDSLERSLAKYRADGYWVKAWEELPLDLQANEWTGPETMADILEAVDAAQDVTP